MRLSLILISFAFSTHVMANESFQHQELVSQAKQHARALGKALKTELVTSMKQDGPVAAIHVCNVHAPAISMELSQNGWQVGRTALKIRNAENAPDNWETATLEQFAEQLAAGVEANQLVASKSENGEFRFMQAIPTSGACLICHGESVSTEINNTINTLYPDDKATGFKLGQLRGAFTLRKKL